MNNHLIDQGYFEGVNYSGIIQKLGLGSSFNTPSSGTGYGVGVPLATGSNSFGGGFLFSNLHTGDFIGYYSGTGVSGTVIVLSVTPVQMSSYAETVSATTDTAFPTHDFTIFYLPTSNLIVDKISYVINTVGQNINIFQLYGVFQPGETISYLNPDDSSGTIIADTVTLSFVQGGISGYQINTSSDTSNIQVSAAFYIPSSGGGGSGNGRLLAQLLAQRTKLRLSR